MSPSLRLLMTADTVGGVWTYALDLAERLGTQGVEVHLATMGGPLSDAQCARAGALSHLTLHESAYKLMWMAEPWADVEAAGQWLMDLARQVEPDLVHLNDYAHAALPWACPVLVVGHSCVLSWWAAVHGEAAPSDWDRYRRTVREGLAAADAVVAPTQAMLQALEQHYGALPPSYVVYNARSGRHYRPGRKEPFILAAGRLWDEAKGIDRLARVARHLPWEARVAGDAEHPDEGVVTFDNIVALGHLSPDALAREMGCAAIYALPARYEPFGLSALEAALSGCCLVLGDIPSLREVWGDAALYADDDRALEAALRALIESRQLRTEYARRARARALRYTLERMGSNYRALYTRLLTSSPRSRRAWTSSSSTTPSAPTGTTATLISSAASRPSSSPVATV